MKLIKVGSDFSGVGAFDYAIQRVAENKGFKVQTVYACDWDKYARITYAHNHGEPPYYPKDVYEREIPEDSLDIYMTSPPCQAFSLSGKRLGKEDERGILFFNSHEFIQKNQPRFFIFENVKGLLSDDSGKTFSEWINMLGGKSVNGLPVLFHYEDSVPYHVYWKVLNSKEHGVPQNRERVFIIGIRDDQDNIFQFPKEEHLTKRLKDVLENEVDEKYFLSESAINSILLNDENIQKSKVDPDIASALQTPGHSCETYKGMNAISIRSATSKGYEEATEGDSIYLGHPNSETRRGRVGKGVAQTLDIGNNQGVIQLNPSLESGGKQPYQQNRVYDSNAICPALNAGQVTWGGNIVTLPNDYKIRRLTPRECFRLMDFPDTFTWKVSDSQAYKQAGNSIVVGVLAKIIAKLKL